MIKAGSKVKCIDNSRAENVLVHGKVYEVLKVAWGNNLYLGTKDPSGENVDGWSQRRFVEVGCPCAIKTCLTHRVAK